MRSSVLALLAALAGAAGAWAQGVPGQSALPPEVESAPLGQFDPGAAGLLPSRVTGLPATLWRASDGVALEGLIGAVRPPVPALQGLMRSLMLAEAEPPQGQGLAFLAARLDWLIANGAVEEALALTELVGQDSPELFARWADLTLLIGRPGPVCQTLAARPGLSEDLSLQVFCSARGGDWARAALVLGSGVTLGDISSRRADLLARFLDPELAEVRPALLPPVRPTPLEFRLFEALGEPLPTAPLPLPFSVLDLSGDIGWRAQIEAAERLARAGALPANRLLGLYTLRTPAASGGVWDRARAFQNFEAALDGGNPSIIGPALERLWPQMANARLLVPLAELFAEQVADLPLKGRAARMAQVMLFLSPGYESLTIDRSEAPAFLRSIARGAAPDTASDLPYAEPIAAAWSEAEMPDVLRSQLVQDRLGEVILRAIALFDSGAQGNSGDLTDALVVLRSVGLEDVARRAALQLMLLQSERAL